MGSNIKQFFSDYLEPISKFLATHGLAVFLVVYYATVLYPDVTKERAAWIIQLQKLEESIDPEGRPLTRSQTQTILDYVSDLFINSLLTNIQKNMIRSGDSDSSVAGIELKQNEASIILDGKQFNLKFSEAFDVQVHDLNKKFDLLILSGRESVAEAIEFNYNRNERLANLNSGKLSKFKTQKGNLDKVWMNAFKGNHQWLRTELIKAFVKEKLIVFYRAYVDFLRNHPGYDSQYDPEKLQGLAVADVINDFKIKIYDFTEDWPEVGSA